jgi:hypothetical protein
VTGSAGAWLAAGLFVVGCAGCRAAPGPEVDAARLASLRTIYDDLHGRLEKAVAQDPLAQRVFADRGQVVVAIRSGLIEELAGTVTQRYLDRVSIDLTSVEARDEGAIHKKTFLGQIKVGEWAVDIDITDLRITLVAGKPKVSLGADDRVEIELPVDVKESEGRVGIHFSWNSKSLANLVCKDFDLTRDLRGRVLPQQHVLSGALRIGSAGDSLSLTPVFPDRKIPLKVDLTPASWQTVEAALRTQNTADRCGTLMKPDNLVRLLRELAAKGVKVGLPESIFRVVHLPAHLEQTVKIGDRTVNLTVKSEGLKVLPDSLWTSASAHVRPLAPSAP